MSKQALQLAIEIAGSQSALADGIRDYLGTKFTQQAISYWVTRETPIDAKYCVAIEHVTGGKVTRSDLRPDIFDGAVLAAKRRFEKPAVKAAG